MQKNSLLLVSAADDRQTRTIQLLYIANDMMADLRLAFYRMDHGILLLQSGESVFNVLFIDGINDLLDRCVLQILNGENGADIEGHLESQTFSIIEPHVFDLRHGNRFVLVVFQYFADRLLKIGAIDLFFDLFAEHLFDQMQRHLALAKALEFDALRIRSIRLGQFWTHFVRSHLSRDHSVPIFLFGALILQISIPSFFCDMGIEKAVVQQACGFCRVREGDLNPQSIGH